MEMFGKVVSPKRNSLSINGQPELLINHKSGRITLSNELMSKLNCSDGMIGFAYDPNQDLNSAVAFMYIMDDDAAGCKVGKSGAVTSRFHADRMKGAFPNDLSEDANRFKLDVDVENPITYNETQVYPITFKEELANITRTRAPHAQVNVEASVEVEKEMSIEDTNNETDQAVQSWS